MKNKPIVQEKSSEKVAKFLEKNSLHKKDFAEMIGVTLSYVYNLIDDTIPFSTRTTTLERIATVMEIAPEEFEEYKIPQEPILIDDSVEFFKDVMKEKGMSVINFLKAFPRKKRLDIVDMLRGTLPIPIDFKELTMIAQVLDLNEAGFRIKRHEYIFKCSSSQFNVWLRKEIYSPKITKNYDLFQGRNFFWKK